jgi:hypothetical protein
MKLVFRESQPTQHLSDAGLKGKASRTIEGLQFTPITLNRAGALLFIRCRHQRLEAPELRLSCPQARKDSLHRLP